MSFFIGIFFIYKKKGWNINLIVPEYPNVDVSSLIPEEWNVIELPSRRWWFPPYRKNHRVLRIIRFYLLSVIAKDFIKKAGPTVLLSYISGSVFAGFAVFLKKKLHIPLISFFHDDQNLLHGKSKNNGLSKRVGKNRNHYTSITIANSDLILAVTKQLANSIKLINSSSKVLLPIPHSIKLDVPVWNDWFSSPVIGVAGKLYPSYYDLFKQLLRNLKSFKGRLVIVTDQVEIVAPLKKDFDNIDIIPSFKENEEVLRFFVNNVSAIFVGYPNDLDKMPWLESCFPSKLIEFNQVKLPILTISPPDTAFYDWCIEKRWGGFIPEYSDTAFCSILSKVTNKAEWTKLVMQCKELAETEIPKKRQI